jgi:prepilin-type N-terminal cleavage/methylation domain-containing protein
MMKNNQNAGYTLIELIVIVMIIGVLFAIVAPAWAGFVNNQRLKVGNEQVFRAMEEAKSNANYLANKF